MTSACDEPPRAVVVPVGGEEMVGVFWRPRKEQSPAVLLIHQPGGQKEDWTPLFKKLHDAGFGVLAFDLREQGRLNAVQLLQDVRAGFALLRAMERVDAARIGLVGARAGADAALVAAAEDPLVQVVVLLSPDLSLQGLFLEPVVREYGYRPMMLAAAEGDAHTADAANRLAETVWGETALKLYPGEAGGTGLLEDGSPVARDLIEFLRANL